MAVIKGEGKEIANICSVRGRAMDIQRITFNLLSEGVMRLVTQCMLGLSCFYLLNFSSCNKPVIPVFKKVICNLLR